MNEEQPEDMEEFRSRLRTILVYIQIATYIIGGFVLIKLLFSKAF